MKVNKRGDLLVKCDLCEAEVPDENIKHVHVKGKVKNVCDGCITSVKGLA